jgi:hypothetical protein
MANAITSATHADPASVTATTTTPAAKSAPSQKSAQTPATSTASIPKDTVRISVAAQTALQETTETQAQTAKEAGKGDLQAQRLLAKETAAKT